MWFFSRKHKILETPFFEGFKDFHNHTLPAVDDGVKSLEESLSVLAYFEGLGVSEVVLTPHVMVGVNDSSSFVNLQFESLKSAYAGPIKLSLASEYMLDSNFLTHLESGECRGISPSTLLVETSYMSAPSNFKELLYSVAEKGITPLIAHPERYLYMNRGSYHSLREREYCFQLNLLSLSGAYGEKATKAAEYLLEQDMYDVVGTDLHSLGSFKRRAEKVVLPAKQIDKLLELKENIL